MIIYEDMPGNFTQDSTSQTIVYNVIDAVGIDPRVVRAAVLNQAPKSFPYPADSPLAWPQRRYHQTEVGPGVYRAEITYSVLAYQFAFELNGSQQHVRQSKETIAGYGDAAADKDMFKKVVGWDGRTVHGVSIYVPSSTWTETVEAPVEEVDQAYRATVEALLASPVNDGTFRGREAGEVMFLGCSGSINTGNPDFFTLSFKFSSERNRSVAGGNALTIGDIDGIEKEGWEYLWVYYEPTPDMTANVMIPKPASVLVERMYDSGDFGNLNIGTGETILWGGV